MNFKSNYFVVAIVMAMFLFCGVALAKTSNKDLDLQTMQQLEMQKADQLGSPNISQQDSELEQIDAANLREATNISQRDLELQKIRQQAATANLDLKEVTIETAEPPLLLRHGGPDAGGYFYIDSDDDATNAPVYNWIDISAVGTTVSFTHGTLDDGWSDPIALGMDFVFYGQLYSSFSVTTNGILSFDALAGAYLTNANIPATAVPNNLIAPEWDDMDARSGGSVYYYYDPTENRFIVSWTDWSYYPATTAPNAPHNFQVILDADDYSIVCQYGDISGAWHTDITQGIEDATGGIGTLYAYNNGATYTGLAVYYGLDAPIYGTHNVGPTQFLAPGLNGQVGTPVTPQVEFRNVGASAETFPVRLLVKEGPTTIYNQTATITNLPAGQATTATFPDFTPANPSIYTMIAISELTGDENLLNDTLQFTFQAFAQIVYYDFEADGIFTPTGDWQWGVPTSGPNSAHSGSKVWATTLGGNYPLSDNATLTTAEFTLGISSILKFWHWFDTEASYDGGNVKISSDNGITWNLLHPADGYSGVANTYNPLYPDSIFTGHTAGIFWQEETFDLSAYNNQTVIFRFNFGSDPSIAYPGWYIDDFTLLGAGTFSHNAGPTRFIAPPPYGQVGVAVTPQIEFRNVGEVTESFPVRLRILLGASEVYNQTAQITNLPSHQSATATFPQFTPASEALYTMYAISELVGDESPSNDTLQRAFRAYQQIISYDFESAGLFTPTGDWQWGTPTSPPIAPHSGVKLWATNLGGNYANSDNATLTTAEFTLGISSILKFWRWYDTESGYDGGNVKVSSDNGITWHLIHPEGGYDVASYSTCPLYPDSLFGGHVGGQSWTEETFDLSDYNNQTVSIRFDFGSNASTNFAGWYIDDFSLLGAGTYAHNVGPTRFLAPPAIGQVGTPVTPQVEFRNVGDNTESFPVRLRILLGASEVYNQTAQINNLPSHQSATATFPAFTPAAEAIYTMYAISELVGDLSASNDTLQRAFQAFQHIVYEDFESDGVFTPTGDWEWGTPTSGPNAAHSGSNLWATTLGGNYPLSDLATLTTLEYTLGISCILKFWHWYNTEASYDGGNVKISSDNGNTWQLLYPANGYSGKANASNPLYPDSIFTGHTAGIQWAEATFDLSAYDNQIILLRFDFGSDASVAYPGWYIDDFTLLGAGTYAHNVGPTRFLAPGLYGQAGTPVTPQVQFKNTGDNTESFPVRLKVFQGANEVYNQTGQVDNLASRAFVTVAFPQFTPATENVYTLVAISELATDLVPANDTLRFNFQVYTNIAYYDFEADGIFIPTGDWEWGIPTSGPNVAHSGSNLWATTLGGNYPLSDLATLTTTPFGLGANPILNFWHWYYIESRYDGGNVKISTDAGNTWELLHPMDGYDGTPQTANPLYPDSIFTGTHQSWSQALFDLSAYGGQSVLFRLDFGSDASIAYPGWYVDDFTILGGGGVEPGWVTGTVTRLAGGQLINGAIVSIGRLADTTAADGIYWLQIFPGTYAVTAAAPYYNSSIANVTIVQDDTVTQNFALTAPVIQVDTSSIFDTLGLGFSRDHIKAISNTGNGPLDFNIRVSYGTLLRPGYIHKQSGSAFGALLNSSEATEVSPTITHGNPPFITDFGDELFTFDPQLGTADLACLGVEFDGAHFWVTGRHSQDDIHKLHKYNSQGVWMQSYNQGTSSDWGWRDLAFDGRYLYASDEFELAKIDTATGLKVGTLTPPPGFTMPCRGLAYDPVSGHFWTANFSSSIVEFDRQGNEVHSYTNSLNIYGLAWDNVSPGGPFLWTFSQDGTPAILISQFNPTTGSYTGVTFYAIDHTGDNNDLAGGACFTTQWNPAFGILFCLVQGSDAVGNSVDLVQGYEIAPYSTWLVLDPRTGTINPGGSTNLTITLDLTGQGVQGDTTYTATLIIDNNSPINPQIYVSLRAIVGIDDIEVIPNAYALFQNYPNPFNSNTEIMFALPKISQVELTVFNVLGQKVATLVNGKLDVGIHRVNWDASNVASGIYYYKITAGEYSKIEQMTLLK